MQKDADAHDSALAPPSVLKIGPLQEPPVKLKAPPVVFARHHEVEGHDTVVADEAPGKPVGALHE
jgi:hypothetical protein